MSKRLLVLSTSTIYGSPYLQYAEDQIKSFFNGKDVLFIPFARPSGISHEEYTQKATTVFDRLGLKITGIHEFDDMKQAAEQASAYFIGGGNTFLLLKMIYESGIYSIIKKNVNQGALYMGTSAGSNLVGQSINTTNDMPITYPPSFEAFGFIPYNLNPHYLDPEPNSTHMGETRETRINEFHTQNDIPVIGLREGSWLDVKDDKIILNGDLTARIFKAGEDPIEMDPGANLQNL